MGHVAYALQWGDGMALGIANGSDSDYTHGALCFNDTLIYCQYGWMT
jgi:hypothetical protein